MGADCVAFDFFGDLMEHIDLLHPGIARHHAVHYAIDPAEAFTARRALAAALVHVEI